MGIPLLNDTHRASFTKIDLVPGQIRARWHWRKILDGLEDDDVGKGGDIINISQHGGASRIPHSVTLGLPLHLAFFVHRDAGRSGSSFSEKLNQMVIEYLEAYYEDEMHSLDDEQLQLFSIEQMNLDANDRKE